MRIKGEKISKDKRNPNLARRTNCLREIDYVTPNAKFSQHTSLLYIFEDNEAVLSHSHHAFGKKCRYVCETGESEKNVRAATCCLYPPPPPPSLARESPFSAARKPCLKTINSQFTHWSSCHSWSYHGSFQYVSRHCVPSNQCGDHDGEEEDDGVVVDEKCVLQFGLSHTKYC